MKKSTLNKRFMEFVKTRNLFLPGEKVLAAVSGGIDSMVLLHLLYSCRKGLAIKLGIVHLQHNIRGGEAQDDLQFVAKTAEKLSLPFYKLYADVPEMARTNRLSLEEAARKAREQAFEKIAAEDEYHKIATAHHLDDQAETVLMRLLSGSGLQGLAGIRLQREKWVRPLLFAARSEIEAYAAREKIEYRSDRTNLDLSIPRNKIRRNLLPLLETEYDAGIKPHLANLSGILQEWDEYLEQTLAEALKDPVIRQVQNKISLDINRFNRYFSWIQIRLLQHILKQLNAEKVAITHRKFTAFKRWLQTGESGSEYIWHPGLRLCRQSDSVL
ncbi:MAG: tRNA lysidine(34) synthetase TilS, partial [Calditrichia bacterium]